MARARGHSVVEEARAYQLKREHWLDLVYEWLDNERNRYIMIRHVLDGVTFEQLNKELKAMGQYELSNRQFSRIISKSFDILEKHI